MREERDGGGRDNGRVAGGTGDKPQYSSLALRRPSSMEVTCDATVTLPPHDAGPLCP